MTRDRYPRTRREDGEAIDADIRRALSQIGIEMELTGPAREMPEPEWRPRRNDLVALGWPARALDIAERPNDSNAMRAVGAWRRDESALVLAGGKGTGKTVAATWVALNDERLWRFARAATIVRVGRFGDAFSQLIAAPALCIDDLGAEYIDVKGSFLSDLDELVDTFYSNRRPLIVTTNLDAKAFKDRYGARVVDRLTECAQWVGIDGRSMRRPHDETKPPWED
jgi:hypothetical protein